MIQDLENQLQKEDNDSSMGKNKSLEENLLNNLKIIQIIRKRIVLKEKAFNLIPKVMKGVYVGLCQFLLLKGMLFEIFSFESILYSDENVLKLPHWEVFREKSGFAKFVSLVMAMENRLFDHMDSSLDMAKQGAQAIGKGQAIPMIWKYLNDDPYQDPEPVLKALLPMIITRFLSYSEYLSNKKTEKGANKGMLKICLQLILMTYETGVFDVDELMVDHYERLQKRRREKDPKVLESVYRDLAG